MSEEQGLSLLDIGPQSEMVPVGEKKLNVYGVSAKGIFLLLTRFPQLRTWFAGQAGQKLDIGQLVAELPDGIAAIIAAGCGLPGNPAAEEAAAAMAVESQLDILEAIGRLTFKNGFGPFAERIVTLSGAAQSVNYGRAQAMKSPKDLKPSESPETPTSGI